MITAIAFYCYPVSNVPNARHFYEDILGLKLATNFRDEWLEYELGEGTFAITTMDMTHVAGAKGGVIAFEVDQLDKTVTELKEKSVKFLLEITATPVCPFAVVADPDGNEIIIHKRDA